MEKKTQSIARSAQSRKKARAAVVTLDDNLEIVESQQIEVGPMD